MSHIDVVIMVIYPMINKVSILFLLISIIIMLGSHFFIVLPRLFALRISGAFYLFTTGNTWLGLVLTIVYIGGILVLFSYFLTLSPSSPIRVHYLLFLTPILVINWSVRSVEITSTPFRIINLYLLFVFIFSVSWLFYTIIIVTCIRVRTWGPLRVWTKW